MQRYTRTNQASQIEKKKDEIHEHIPRSIYIYYHPESLHDVDRRAGVEAGADAVHEERRLGAADHLA